MKKVTIIIPVYNVACYIDKCLQSVAVQTYHNIEIVLVDDGSTDNSGYICDDFAIRHDAITKVIHSENHGPSAARNLGLSVAEGDYVTFIDSDDWVEPNFVEILVRCMEQDNADMSCCGLLYDYNEGKNPVHIIEKDMVYDHQETYRHILMDTQYYGYVCNKMFRRTLISDMRFDESLRSSEDMDFTTRYAALAKKSVYNGSQLYHYRQRMGSMTGDFSYSHIKLSVLRVNHSLISRYEKECPELAGQTVINYVKTNLNILGRLGISHIKDEELSSKLNDNITQYWERCMANSSLSQRINLFLTRISPVAMLKIKQFIIKRRYK